MHPIARTPGPARRRRTPLAVTGTPRAVPQPHVPRWGLPLAALALALCGSGCSTVPLSPPPPATRASVAAASAPQSGLSLRSTAPRGTAISPALTLSVSALPFSVTAVGATTLAQPIRLTNSGSGRLDFLSSINVSGANSVDFARTTTCGSSLAPGTSCTLSLSFTPTGVGERFAQLQIVTNASFEPARLPLSGTAVAAGVPTLIPGANLNLPFTEGAGTVAHDTTGNGNACTFASGRNAPSWLNGGLQLNDGSTGDQRFCTLPAAASLNDRSAMNSRTLTMCAFFNPITQQNGFAYAPAFGGSTREHIGALWLSGDTGTRTAYYMGEYFGYGGIAAASPQPLVGYHCITYALGSTTDGTTDHLYIDDAEVSSYSSHGTLWDLRQPGDFYSIGAMPWDIGGFLWATVYTVLGYPTQLTSASIAYNYQILKQTAFFSRGVGASPAQNATSANVLVINGDSITNQTPGGIAPYPYLLNLTSHFTISNTAISGKTLKTEVADLPLIDLPLYSPNAPIALASNAAGINDLSVGDISTAHVISNREAIYAMYRQRGFTVLVPTLLSSNNHDTEIQTINTALRSMALTNGYTLVDWANEPCLGASGASANLNGCSYFQDGLHPNQAGEALMAVLYSNIVNYLTGATASAPTVVASASYTLSPADRFLDATAGSAQVLSLPPCQGWSTTTPFTIHNTGPAHAVAVAPPPASSLNGGAPAAVVPAGATIQFYADILSATGSGCAWHSR